MIPVLIGGAEVPKAEQLPQDIAALAGRNAIEISESRFDYDASRLIEAIEKTGVLAKPASGTLATPPQEWWDRISDKINQRTLKFIGSGVAVLVGGIWTLYTYFSDKDPAPATGPPITASAWRDCRRRQRNRLRAAISISVYLLRNSRNGAASSRMKRSLN